MFRITIWFSTIFYLYIFFWYRALDTYWLILVEIVADEFF